MKQYGTICYINITLNSMVIYLASDHAGFDMKTAIWKAFEDGFFGDGYALVDCGASLLKEDDDYPEYMAKASEKVAEDALHAPSMAIIFGGSGTGEAIVANRYPHVRAAVYQGGNIELVKLAREHNDANILSIGARFATEDQAKNAVMMFLTTPFSHDERHERRILAIEEISIPRA